MPNKANGRMNTLTHGTAIRLTAGPLTLTGRFSASKTGSSPSAINHWARDQLRSQLQAPKRPPKITIKIATAKNDSQKPGRKLTNGSAISTRFNVIKNGQTAPTWRYRNRHNNTSPSMAQARCTGT